MSEAAWVQIDHGKVWDLQKEPVLALDGVEAVMATTACSVEPSPQYERKEPLDLDNLKHFSVFNVHITVDKVPDSQLTETDPSYIV